MNWQSAVERTVMGLGYDLVDAEKSAGGLLRVLIDHPQAAPPQAADAKFITVDDCERVTRQLQHVLEVEGCAYERLEVSSPGLDRPLKKTADYARFCGEQVEITLKVPFKGRKKYLGALQAATDGTASGWRLVLPVEGSKGANRAAKRHAAFDTEAPSQVLDFSLEEVREARLVPVVDFKGRRLANARLGTATPATPASAQSDDGVDGGRIQ